MSTEKKNRRKPAGGQDRDSRTTSIRGGSLKLAQLAAPFVGESITDFLSKAADGRALPILKNHNVRLPEGAVPCGAE